MRQTLAASAIWLRTTSMDIYVLVVNGPSTTKLPAHLTLEIISTLHPTAIYLWMIPKSPT
jgi:hypothetical protein